jgi:transcriptional regulator with XRE-family HTH domain
MHFFNPAVARLAADFKARAWESIQDHEITQEDIAAALSIEQSTVSRWMNTTGDLHFPASLLPALFDPKVAPLRSDLLVFLASRSGCVITERPKVVDLDGSLQDETMELAKYLGRIAEQVASGKMDVKKARRDIAMMRKALDKAEAELGINCDD